MTTKKPKEKDVTAKQIKDRMLSDLNDFMKEFSIDAIHFGNTHKIKRTKNKKAKDIIK